MQSDVDVDCWRLAADSQHARCRLCGISSPKCHDSARKFRIHISNLDVSISLPFITETRSLSNLMHSWLAIFPCSSTSSSNAMGINGNSSQNMFSYARLSPLLVLLCASVVRVCGFNVSANRKAATRLPTVHGDTRRRQTSFGLGISSIYH